MSTNGNLIDDSGPEYDKDFPLLLFVITEGKYQTGNYLSELDEAASKFFVELKIIPRVGDWIGVLRPDEDNELSRHDFQVVAVEFDTTEKTIDVFIQDECGD